MYMTDTLVCLYNDNLNSEDAYCEFQFDAEFINDEQGSRWEFSRLEIVRVSLGAETQADRDLLIRIFGKDEVLRVEHGDNFTEAAIKYMESN